MAIEIVDLPIENGGSFHSYVNVYQRVHFLKKKFFGGNARQKKWEYMGIIMNNTILTGRKLVDSR